MTNDLDSKKRHRQRRSKNIALLIALLGLAALFFVITIVKMKEQIRGAIPHPPSTVTAPGRFNIVPGGFDSRIAHIGTLSASSIGCTASHGTGLRPDPGNAAARCAGMSAIASAG